MMPPINLTEDAIELLKTTDGQVMYVSLKYN